MRRMQLLWCCFWTTLVAVTGTTCAAQDDEQVGGISDRSCQVVMAKAFPVAVAQDLGAKLSEVLREKAALAKPVAMLRLRCVGVLSDDLAGDIARVVAQPLEEDIATVLATKGVRVVERSQISRVIEELSRAQAGVTDSAIALRVGKMIPGSTAVVGSVSPRGAGVWVIHLTAVATEKGEVVGEVTATYDAASGKLQINGGVGPTWHAEEIGRLLGERKPDARNGRTVAVVRPVIVGTRDEVKARWSKVLGDPLQEDLCGALARQGFRVLERSRVQDLIEEVTRENSGLTEEQAALKLGQLLPGAVLLVSSISARVFPTYQVNTRLVDAASGDSVAGVQVDAPEILPAGFVVWEQRGGSAFATMSTGGGALVAAASADRGAIRLLRVSDGESSRTLAAPAATAKQDDEGANQAEPGTDRVDGAAFSTTGSQLASLWGWRRLTTWQVSGNWSEQTIDLDPRLMGKVAEFSPALDVLVSGYQAQSVVFKGYHHDRLVVSLQTAAAKGPPQLLVWNLQEYTGLNAPDDANAEKQGITSLAMSRDGRFLASGHSSGLMALWSVPRSAGAAVVQPKTVQAGAHGSESARPLVSLAFSADDKMVAAQADDGRVDIWTVDDLKPVRDLLPRQPAADGPKAQGQGAIRFRRDGKGRGAIRFRRDGKALAAIQQNGVLNVWRLDDGAVLFSSITVGKGDEATDLAWSEDGRSIAVASTNAVRLWYLGTKP